MNSDQLAMLIVPILIGGLLSAGLYVLTSIALGKVFIKLGEAGWAAWVPVLNTIVVFRLGGKSALWTILLFVPFANIAALVIYYMAIHTINRRMGKGAGYTVLAIFVFVVWACLLGFSTARDLTPVRDAAPLIPPSYAAFSALTPIPDAPVAAVPASPGPPPPFAAPAAPPFGSMPPSPQAPETKAPAAAAAVAAVAEPTPTAMWAAPPPPPVWAAPPSTAPAARSTATTPPATDAPAAWSPPANNLTAASQRPLASAPVPVPVPVLPTPAPVPASTIPPPAPMMDPAPSPTPAPVPAPEEFDEATVISVRRFAPWTLETDGTHRESIVRPVVILGRSPSADPDFPDAQLIAVQDARKTVSKSHARLEFAGGSWSVTDLGSTNGVVLLGPSGDETEIEPGARVGLTAQFLLGELPARLYPEGS